MSNPNSLRTPAVAAVLDAVRTTGKSAHPKRDELVSELVLAVAILHNLNPTELQRDVDAYADALDASVDTSDELDRPTDYIAITFETIGVRVVEARDADAAIESVRHLKPVSYTRLTLRELNAFRAR